MKKGEVGALTRGIFRKFSRFAEFPYSPLILSTVVAVLRRRSASYFPVNMCAHKVAQGGEPLLRLPDDVALEVGSAILTSFQLEDTVLKRDGFELC